MVNHVRTLLLNSPRGAFAHNFPGEEYVPAAYQTLPEPSAVKRLYKHLFGSHPDRYMKNYRLRQLLPYAHLGELASHAALRDGRLTYWPPERLDLYKDPFGWTTTAINSSTGSLWLIGDVVSNDATGRLYSQHRITVADGSLVRVRRYTPPVNDQMLEYTMTGGLSAPLALHGLTSQFVFNGAPGSDWLLDVIARPTKNAADLFTGLVGAVDEIGLFGVTRDEPYATYRALWKKQDYHPYKLGAVLLAAAYRLEDSAPAPLA